VYIVKKSISATLLLGMLFSITTSAFAAGRIPPNYQSDTGARLTIAPDKTYQFKITSGTAPVITVGNRSVIEIVSHKSFGSAYYFTIKAVGKPGQSAGVYLNGTRITVCTIEESTSQLPNPLVSYSTLDEARKAVGFAFAVPTSFPTEYQRKDIIVIGNYLAEIFYNKGDQKILYRTARGNSDISGNDTAYEEVKTVAVGSSKVTMKGKNGLVNLAIWSKDGISYSLDFDEACDQNTVFSIVAGVK
jgi:hypothetical protein